MITACVIISVFTSSALNVRAEDDLKRQFRVLFISSYGYSNAAVPQQLEGFKNGIDGLNVEINYEFMDAEKFYGGVDIANFDKYLRYKIFAIKDYDLIAVADDPALRYATNNRVRLFPDIPLVFMGVNNQTEAVTAAAMKNATGISENPDFESNYRLMRSLFPEREVLNVVVDSTVAGQGDYVEFMKFKDAHPDVPSNIINTSYYTAEGLKETLAGLGPKDIILFLDFAVDGENNGYSLTNAAEFLSEYAPDIPIIRLASSDIGHGVLGGLSYSYFDAGKIAGDAAKRILLGASTDNMPLMTSTVTTPYFEQGEMDEFGLKYSNLPDGSIVVNEHNNFGKFYRENQVLSNLVFVIAVLMVVIISMLYVTNIRKKKIINTDFLTQMPNRKSLIEDMNQFISVNEPFGIIMMDVDYFKNINDTYGHVVGDEIIKGVGDRLKKMSAKNVSFARLGGDEFCGLFTLPYEKASKLCKKIAAITDKPFKTSAGELSITMSLGCAMYPMDTPDAQKVMECADSALYVTKKNGRNGYTLFGSTDTR